MTITGSSPAYLDALFKVARFGASRFGAYSGRGFISIGGIFLGEARDDAWDPGILNGSLSIQDLLDERPNTMSFSAWNLKPAIGAEVIVTLGSKNNATRLFAGFVISTNQVYISKPVNRVFHCSCIDYTWRLMQLKAYGFYTNQSATAIVQDLLARFAPNVSPRYIQAGLPLIDEITITNEDLPSVFKRIANRIGAYFYVDESAPGGALHFFTTEAKQNPRALTPSHPSLSNVEREGDLSQLVTRALSAGGGGNAVAAIAPGDSSIPVDVGVWYAPAGGYAAVGPNRIRYTGLSGIVAGGASAGGSLVGTGVAPSAAPGATAGTGAGIEAGAHQYAYTWVTAAGETRPSPIATVTLGIVPTPASAPALSLSGNVPSPSQNYFPGDTVEVAYSYATSEADLATSGPISPIVSTVAVASPYSGGGPPLQTLAYTIVATVAPSLDPLVKWIRVWHRVNGIGWLVLTQAIPNPNPMGYAYGLFGAVVSGTPSAGLTVGRVALTALAVGPATVTSRKVYRTVANGSALKLLATLADNTTTTLADSASDATLTTAAPVVDTSGLKGLEGQVNPGATSMLVAGTGWATATGGWAIIGNGTQAIRYTGITATTLTGIPPSGSGAVIAAVPYNSSITAAPALMGIPAAGDPFAVRWPVKPGDQVNVLAIADDLNAQAALRALDPTHSGIVEEYISDGRLSLIEATARAGALLSSKSAPLITLRYTSRDVTTRSGATVTADLPPPTDVHETLKVQQVTIDNFNLSPATGLPPTFHVMASSDRFSFEDLLRQVRPE